MQMDDLSGVEGEWGASNAPEPKIVGDLLGFAGEVYFPFLLANARAVADKREMFAFSALGMPYEQGAFKYQARCLDALRVRFAALGEDAKDSLRPRLAETGCLAPLTTAG